MAGVMENEIKDYLILFIDEFGDRAIEKMAEKLNRVHRGNAINIIRGWMEELGKKKYAESRRQLYALRANKK
jgi:hypothetical protein